MRHIAAILTLACAPVHAALVFDNGAPNGLNGNEMTGWIQAEDFILSGPMNITGIRFWAFTLSGGAYSGSIYWEIRNDASGAPGAVVSGASGLVTLTPVNEGPLAFGGNNRLRFDIPVSGVTLSGGTTYWLALHNGPLTNDRVQFMYWETTNSGFGVSGNELFTPFTGSWSSNGLEHAFQIFGERLDGGGSGGGGEIPEPSTWVLMSAGIGLLALRRRA